MNKPTDLTMADGNAVKLFIGQVPKEWGEKELRETFGKYGEIAFMKVITDRESGQPKGTVMFF